MSAIFAILGLAFVITLIVAFHEFGHFSTAKMAGVGVNEFAIGFGPQIFGFKKGETDYAYRAIPLGGYVDLIGMEEDPDATPEEKEKEFVGKSALWRITILFAGGFMNFVLAYLIFIGVYTFAGQPVQPTVSVSVVSYVVQDSPAAKAGIQINDKFIAVDDQEISSWTEFRNLIQENVNKETVLKIERDGSIIDLKITPDPREDDPTKGAIGIISSIPPLVGDIMITAPAEGFGFLPADRILSVNGNEIEFMHQFDEYVKNAASNEVELKVLVKRRTGEVELKFTPQSEILGMLPSYEAIIGKTNPGSPAEAAGLSDGDKIISIENVKIESWHEMVSHISANPGKTISVEIISSDNISRTIKIKPDDLGGEGKIGVYIQTEYEPPVGFFRGAVLAYHHTVDITIKTVEGIYKLIKGKISTEQISGPVGIARIVGSQAEDGIWALLRITALLSINIGLLNLFPIPGLDGARICFIFIEIIRRKKMSAEIEEKIHTAGILLLIALIIFVTYKDILKLL